MIMKKSIYAALVAMIIFSGCEYNPLHDGQKFRITHVDYGVIEEDGEHIYIPVQIDEPYLLDLCGGNGNKHSVKIDEPEYLDYTYKKGSVKRKGAKFDPDIIPARVSLTPKKLGNTSITVTEGETDESIMINVNICEAYKAIEVYYSENSIAGGTVLAFRNDGADDIVKICKGQARACRYEHIVDGRYAFVPYNSTICLEITYPADESGQPAKEGKEVTRRFLVEVAYGESFGTPEEMLRAMNLKGISLATRSDWYDDPDNYRDFLFIDITEDENPDRYSPDTKIFYSKRAQMIPWMYPL